MRLNSYPVIFLFLLINLSVVTACKKEKAPERLASGKNPLLEKITSRFRDIDGSVKTYTEIIEYDDEGRITALKDEQGRIYTAIEYAGEVIRRRVEYRMDGI